jgi:hypothetical protein
VSGALLVPFKSQLSLHLSLDLSFKELFEVASRGRILRILLQQLLQTLLGFAGFI